MKNLYLAAPYSHKNPKVCTRRYRLVTKKAAELMDQGYNVFSPVTHSHPISMHIQNSQDHDFWLSRDITYLERWADCLGVYMLPGWRKSVGVRRELGRARELELPHYWIPGDGWLAGVLTRLWAEGIVL